jgi:hypothetical protein
VRIPSIMPTSSPASCWPADAGREILIPSCRFRSDRACSVRHGARSWRRRSARIRRWIGFSFFFHDVLNDDLDEIEQRDERDVYPKQKPKQSVRMNRQQNAVPNEHEDGALD